MPHYEELFAQFHEQPAPSATVAWGDITGTLADQVDLQAALDSKLDASAYTAADVLAKLLTVDGAGSGLDADLLDGQSSAFYLDPANLTAPVPIAQGGTGSATAAAARIALGLEIGVNVQAWDADLQALAGLASAADTLPYFTGSATAALTSFTAFARTLVDDADALTARATLGLVIGTDVQAQDAELQAIAGLVSANNRLPYFTGSGTAALATFPASGRAIINTAGTADTFPYFSAANTVTLASLTAAGRALLDDADAAAQRATLGLGTMATETAANYALLAGAAFTGTISALNVIANDTALRAFVQTTSSITPSLQVGGTTISSSSFGLARWAAIAGAPNIALGYSAGATPGTHAIVADANTLGRISFQGSDGAKFVEAARIEALVNGTPGTDDMPGKLRFMVTPDGASSAVEALVFTQDKAAAFAGAITSSSTARFNSASQGAIGVKAGSGSGATASAAADDLVIDSDTNAGITILSGANNGYLVFGDTAGPAVGQIVYTHSTDTMSLLALGASVLDLSSGLAAVTGSLTVTGGVSGANIYNTYTPTLTAITNVSSSSANLSGWIRIGNAVLVFARISVTATASGALTEIDLSLPVASALSAASQLVGAGSIVTAATEVASVAVSGNATSDRARATFVSSSTSARAYTVMFGYIVI